MKRHLFLIVCSAILITACAAPQQANIPTGNPAELVSQLETNLAEARANQVDVLAPGLFNDAQSNFNKATQGLSQGTKLSKINEYVAQGNASLEKALEIAQVSRTILAETNKARDKALKVGADKLGKPYEDVQKQYMKLTQAIESDNLSYAQKNAGNVQTAFRELEIMAIEQDALGSARDILADAQENKIPKIAPSAYDDATGAISQAETYIRQNPYESEKISQKGANAKFLAQRTMVIGESSEKFKEMSPEQTALYLEKLMTQLGETLKIGDIRDKDVEAQLSALTGAIENIDHKNQALEKENQQYQDQIADLNKQLEGIQGYASAQEAAKRRLAAERAFNERFNEVQHFFRPEEAEVYKQGGQLVIRLKGIKFPVGQATLTPDNYTLLSKVQQAIQTFEKPTVTVEGHTDSTGSTMTNMALSQQRAEAVMTYLIANNTLPENRIKATGYGPDRPLAPNTTPEGRAINRRIDVLISPSQTP